MASTDPGADVFDGPGAGPGVDSGDRVVGDAIGPGRLLVAGAADDDPGVFGIEFPDGDPLGSGAGGAVQRRVRGPDRRETSGGPGTPAKDTWPEAWEIVGGRLDEVMERGHTMHAKDEQRILSPQRVPGGVLLQLFAQPDRRRGRHHRRGVHGGHRDDREGPATNDGCGWSENWARCPPPTPAARPRPAARCCGCWPRRGRRCRSRSRSCGRTTGRSKRSPTTGSPQAPASRD